MQVRWVIIAALCIFSLIVAIGAWTANRNLQQVRNGYGAWGLAEMIIAYSEDHAGVPPRSWAGLAGYESRAGHLITSWDFATVRAKFEIDFEAMQSLSKGDIKDERPQVISLVKGRWIDLGGARPNEMIASYFSSGAVPERASICGEWTGTANDGTKREWIEFGDERIKGAKRGNK